MLLFSADPAAAATALVFVIWFNVLLAFAASKTKTFTVSDHVINLTQTYPYF